MIEKYKTLISIVEKELFCSAHNMDHVKRVFNTCIAISRNENGFYCQTHYCMI